MTDHGLLPKDVLPAVNMVSIGVEGSGKTTALANLVHKLGGVDKETSEKLAAENKKIGNDGQPPIAWLLDTSKDERTQGHTIDVNTRTVQTKKFYLNILDIPGSTKYFKNTLAGISHADVAVVFISAVDFETALAQNSILHQQFRALLAFERCLQKGFVVAITKLDTIQDPQKQEETFNKVKEAVKGALPRFMKLVKDKDLVTRYIPISGTRGDNLTEITYPWYKDIPSQGGKSEASTLIGAIEEFGLLDRDHFDDVARLIVQRVYPTGKGCRALCRVASGPLKQGWSLGVGPRYTDKAVPTLIEIGNSVVKTAYPGNFVTLTFDTMSKLQAGDVLGYGRDNVPTAGKYTVQTKTWTLPSDEVKKGYSPQMFVHGEHVPCRLTDINWTIGPELKKLSTPDAIKNGESAEVRMEPTKDMSIVDFRSDPTPEHELARVVLFDSNKVITYGYVTVM